MLVEVIIRLVGGVLAYSTLAVVLFGIWRGTRRQVGRVTGQMGQVLHSPWFYLITTLIFFGICFLGWSPLPLPVSDEVRTWLLAVGCALYFPGMSFVLWGRLALGKNYFVSTGLGAQVFAGQHLITDGPYALVRHPMYAGLMAAAAGSLLIYATWTTLLFACCAPFMVFRARREEDVLASEFGAQWQAYCRRVPAFLPRLRKENR